MDKMSKKTKDIRTNGHNAKKDVRKNRQMDKREKKRMTKLECV